MSNHDLIAYSMIVVFGCAGWLSAIKFASANDRLRDLLSRKSQPRDARGRFRSCR